MRGEWGYEGMNVNLRANISGLLSKKKRQLYSRVFQWGLQGYNKYHLYTRQRIFCSSCWQVFFFFANATKKLKRFVSKVVGKIVGNIINSKN